MFGDIGKMLRMAGRLKAKLPQIREKIENSQFTGESGHGQVAAVVNGKLGLVSLRIAPELVADLTEQGRLDVDLLSDLIKVAIAAAQQKAADAMQQAMLEVTGGMKLPGLDGLL